MKMKWSKVVLLGGLVASVLVGLLFGDDVATVIANTSELLFCILSSIESYLQKQKVWAVLWLAIIPIIVCGKLESTGMTGAAPGPLLSL